VYQRPPHMRSRRQFLQDGSALAGSVILGHGGTQLAQATATIEGRNDESPSLTTLSLTRMLDLLKRKDISPSELMKAHIARIEELQPKINAVTFLADTQALKTAEALDGKLVRGDVDWSTQFLFGIPFSVKNVMNVAGVATVCGAPAFTRNIAEEDAYYVSRYKAAGAIFLAATNVPFLSLNDEVDNLVFGRTNNPHDLSRTPGGSSGGEAALIAAGGTPVGISTDYGGSIRAPAHWTGLFGLCVAAKGLNWQGFPGSATSNWDKGPPFVRLGTMARAVADLEKVKDVFVEPDARLPTGRTLHNAHKLNLKDFKIIFFTHWPSRPGREPEVAQVTPEVKTAVVRAAEALERGGATVKQDLPEFLKQTYDIADSFALEGYDSDALRRQAKELGAENDALLNRFLLMLDDVAREYPPDVRERFRAAYPSWLNNYTQLMNEYDAIILPVTGTPAPLHGETTQRRIGNTLTSYNFIGTMTDSAASGTAPIMRSPEGLPIGVGVVGGPFAEDKVLRILYELESAFGGFIRPTI